MSTSFPGLDGREQWLREAAWVARYVGRADTSPLREGDLRALAGYLERRETDRGAVLFNAGQAQHGVWVLRTGMVELTVGGGRRPLVVEVLRPGDVEGDISLLLGEPPPYAARALDDVVCLFLPAASFDRLLAEHPPIARRWLSSIATRLARSHGRIVALLGRPLAAQVARLLLDEAIDGIVRFPQRTLAAMLGVHRPALNRALKELERQKAIEVGYGRIRVLDRAVLEGIAAG